MLESPILRSMSAFRNTLVVASSIKVVPSRVEPAFRSERMASSKPLLYSGLHIHALRSREDERRVMAPLYLGQHG